MQTLRDWVHAAAAELGGDYAGRGNSDVRQVSMQQTSSAVADADDELTFKEEQANGFVHDAAVATKHDDFDPDVFNMKFHGRSRFDVPAFKTEPDSKPVGGTLQPN